MNIKEAAEIVENHNKWRMGADIEMQLPKTLTIAFDTLLNAVKENKTIDTDLWSESEIISFGYYCVELYCKSLERKQMLHISTSSIDDWYAEEERQKEEYDAVWKSIAEYEKEIGGHNQKLLASIVHDPHDFIELIDCINVTDKIEWVDEPNFKPEHNPDVYGVFTVTHVDQRSEGMEGDSYSGYMYVKVEGYNQWLKIPYSC